MRTIEVGGLTVAYESKGTGPPLVLLHGGLSDHRDWRPQIDGLPDTFTVVAWDAPGCGGSTDPPGTFRMPEYADCLAGFIEALELGGRPHVLGLSWGSTLALELYRRRPDIPRTLMLAAAYAGWAGSLPPAVVAERLETTLHELGSMPPEQLARAWVPTLFTDRAPVEVVDELVATMREYHPGGARLMLHAMAEADLRDVLPTIDVPTLLLYGDEDQRAGLGIAEEMHTAIPHSTLVTLPQVGHMSNLETPDRFNAAVRAFLERQ